MEAIVVINGKEIPSTALDNLMVSIKRGVVIVEVSYYTNGKAPSAPGSETLSKPMLPRGYLELPKTGVEVVDLDDQTFGELRRLRERERVVLFDEPPESVVAAPPGTVTGTPVQVVSSLRKAGSWPNVCSTLKDFVHMEKQTAEGSIALVRDTGKTLRTIQGWLELSVFDVTAQVERALDSFSDRLAPTPVSFPDYCAWLRSHAIYEALLGVRRSGISLEICFPDKIRFVESVIRYTKMEEIKNGRLEK